MTDLKFKKINVYSKEGYLFNSILNSEYDQIVNYYTPKYSLEPHQQFLSNFVQKNSYFNSFLIYHGTGTGKTVTAVNIIKNIKQFSNIVDLIIIAPSILKETVWIPTLEKWVSKDIIKNTKFVSIDSPKFVDQFDLIFKDINYNNTNILIIDEAHLYFSSLITSETSNRLFTYNILKDKINKENFYTFFLTATPIVNDPRELINLFNLLRPNCLPNKIETFDALFLTSNNDYLFKKRLTGLISYYERSFGDLYPEVKKEIIKIQMSESQKITYSLTEQREQREKGVSNFRQNTLSICDFAPNKNYLNNYLNNDNSFNLKEYIDESTNDEIKSFSPKFNYIINEIKKTKRTCGVYLQKIQKSLEPFRFILERTENFKLANLKNLNLNPPYKTYYMITGNISTEDRKKSIDIFNSKDNIDGKLIKVLLFSKVLSIGVTLKHMELLIISGPDWNMSIIQQIIGRGIRFNSHSSLEKKDRNIKVQYYLMTGYKTETSDEYLNFITEKKYELTTKFLNLLKEVSFDLPFNKNNKEFVGNDIIPFIPRFEYAFNLNNYMNKNITEDSEIIFNNKDKKETIQTQKGKIITCITDKYNNKLDVIVLEIRNNYIVLDKKTKNYIGYLVVDNENLPLFKNSLFIIKDLREYI